jgi:hypothetical protein
LTQFIKEYASGKFELPKKQTEEEDKADEEEAAARDAEEQAAECARTPPLPRAAASLHGMRRSRAAQAKTVFSGGLVASHVIIFTCKARTGPWQGKPPYRLDLARQAGCPLL